MPKKIIIDTDPGIDDAMAILFALAAPEVDVVGITTIFGNVETPVATRNALHLLQFADRAEIPVAQGAERPLCLPYRGPATVVHGDDGLGDIKQPSPTTSAVTQSAAQLIVEMVMANPGAVTLVPIGPLTNLALALLLEPQIVQHVAGVVLMGGAATVNGNVNPAAEANIYNDPHAADLVFTAGWPVTMVGLDVTTKVVMDEPYLAALCTSNGKCGTYIYDICRFYRDFHRRVHQIDATYTHDPSAIAYLIDPTLFQTQQGAIRVVPEGIARGHTLMDRRRHWSRPHEWSTLAPVNVCLEVDADRLLALYQQYILAAF